MLLKVKDPIAKKFAKKFKELVKEIRNYESDTFSSSGSRITQSEAYRIAEKLVLEDMQARIETDTMDGCLLSEELESIRPE